MLHIRLAQTSEEKEKVFKLRYQIYLEEMGYLQKYANHGSGKYVVIIKLGTTTRIIMMNKIPDSANMII